MRVLVFGDSQSQRMGKRLEEILQSAGHAVKRISRAGYSTAKLLAAARKSVTPSNYDVVYVFSGGNDPSASTAPVSALLHYLKPAGRVIFVGLPPATVIANVPLARKVFGSKVSGPNYWLTSGTAKRREDKNRAFKPVVQRSYGTYYDVRDLFAGGKLPPQPDGIHVAGDTARKIAQDLATKLKPTQALWGVAAVAVVVVLALRKFNR